MGCLVPAKDWHVQGALDSHNGCTAGDTRKQSNYTVQYMVGEA